MLGWHGAVPVGAPGTTAMMSVGASFPDGTSGDEGASPGEPDGPRGGVALHYGDPSAEHRALAEGRAFVDLSDWDVVRVSGADRLGWLNSLTSQRMDSLRAGESTETLLLGPSGRIENAAFVLDDGAATWLLTDPGRGAGWADFLESMRFTMRVEIDVRNDLAAIGGFADASPAADGGVPHGSSGRTAEAETEKVESTPAAASLAAANSGSCNRDGSDRDVWSQVAYAETIPLVWVDPWPGPSEGGATYTRPGLAHPAEGWGRLVVLVERRRLHEAAERLTVAGYRPAGVLAWEAARIAAWRPQARDVESKSLPHEFDWLRTAVHLDKGCYRGQETVAKLVNLGRPPRRLVELYLEGPLGDLPTPGTAVEVDGRVAGTVLAAVRHPEDGPIALALLRRAVAVDAVIDVAGFTAGQEAIVDPGGKSSASPAERPGAELRSLDRAKDRRGAFRTPDGQTERAGHGGPDGRRDVGGDRSESAARRRKETT